MSKGITECPECNAILEPYMTAYIGHMKTHGIDLLTEATPTDLEADNE